MPKESIKEWRTAHSQVEVRWGDINRGGVLVGVDRATPFKFVGIPDDDPEKDVEFTGLYVFLSTEEDVDALIKALRKAKRSTFK